MYVKYAHIKSRNVEKVQANSMKNTSNSMKISGNEMME